MKKLQIIFIVMLVIAVGGVYNHLRKVESAALNTVTMATPTGASVATTTSANTGGTVMQKSATYSTEEFVKKVKKEATAMSQLNNHPDEVQKRLKEIASSMQEPDVAELKKSALDTSLNGDERFLSVYILGESALIQAQKSLEDIASTPIPSMKDARLTSQEEILRVQAVESLREPSSIQRVLSRVENSLITDRAQRNLQYRQGKVQNSPEQQDLDALNQLLQKSSQ